MFEHILLRRKPDSEIAVRACAEPKIFEELYRRYSTSVYRFVRYRTNSNEDAEDITADIFLKAMAKIEQYDVKYAFSTWLFTIARNTIIDFWRTKKVTLDLEHIEELIDQSAHKTERIDARLAVEKIMSQVSENDHTLIVLRFEEGLSYAEIAEITGRSETSLRTAFSRLKKALYIHEQTV